MNKKTTFLGGVAFIASVTLSPTSVAEDTLILKWELASGNSACPTVCKAADLKAVPAGGWEGVDYYVCAGEKYGWRPGYNREPNWGNHCIVGHGGKEKFTRPFLCLCTSEDVTGQDQVPSFTLNDDDLAPSVKTVPTEK